MYQVTAKGRTLEELKTAVTDIYNELLNGVKPVSGTVKTMETPVESELSTMSRAELELAEDEEEVESPYTAHSSEQVGAAPVDNPTLSTVDGTELDAEGLPWDKRINTATKTKVKAGTWKNRRGLEDSYVQEVKAELRQALHLKANPTPIPAAPIDANTPIVQPEYETPAAPTMVTPAQPVTPVVPVVEAPPAAVAPVAPPQPAPANGHTLQSFGSNLAMVLAGLINEGKLTQDYINQLKGYFQVTEIWDLNPQQTEEMFNNFVQHGIVQKVG